MKTTLVLMVLALGACREGGGGDGDADVEVDGDTDGDGGELAIFHCEREAEEPYFEPIFGGEGIVVDVADEFARGRDPDLSDGYQRQIGYGAIGHCPGDEAVVVVEQGGETIWTTRTAVSPAGTISLTWVTLAVENGHGDITIESGRAVHSTSYDIIGF